MTIVLRRYDKAEGRFFSAVSTFAVILILSLLYVQNKGLIAYIYGDGHFFAELRVLRMRGGELERFSAQTVQLALFYRRAAVRNISPDVSSPYHGERQHAGWQRAVGAASTIFNSGRAHDVFLAGIRRGTRLRL